jgi:integrase
VTYQHRKIWRLGAAFSIPATGDHPARRIERMCPWWDNSAAAQKELLRELLETRDAELVPAHRLTLAAYLRSWLADMNASPATIVAYRGAVENHIIPALGTITLDRLGPTACQRFLDGLEMAPATKAKTRAILRAALNTAVRRRKIARNPLDGTEPVRVPEHRAATLTAEQAGILIAGTKDDPWGPLWAVLLGSGLRISEALALTWDLFDGQSVKVLYQLARRDGKWVRVPNLKAGRSVDRVALPAFASAALTSIKTADFGLCFKLDGQPIAEWQALDALHAAEKRLGLPKVGLHSLRHTSLTLLADAGVAEDVRQRRAGHSTTTMSRHYVHGAESQDRLAADELDKAIGGKA